MCIRDRKNTVVLCYLRTHRRNWGLTQKELAKLVGTASSVQISRYENGKRAPKIEVALACQVIFGVPPSIMFPDAHALVCLLYTSDGMSSVSLSELETYCLN